MNGVRPPYWDWLTGGYAADSEVALPVMLRHFEQPAIFWQTVQNTLEAAGQSAEGSRSALAEIERWRAKDRWRKIVKGAHLPRGHEPVDWKKLGKDVDRFHLAVLDLLPDVLKYFQQAHTALREQEGNGPRATEMRDILYKMGGRDVKWRFFGDPAIQRRCAVDFPVAAVRDFDSPEKARGCILEMSVELIEPGTAEVIPHPRLALGGMEAESTAAFVRHAGNALKAALLLTRDQDASQPTAAFSCPELLNVGGARLEGASAGGAFALAFERALRGLHYDRRVLVISTIDATGNLGPVDNECSKANIDFGRKGQFDEKTSLRLKAHGVWEHNRTKPEPDDPNRIDTIAVVATQRKEMEDAVALCDFVDPPEVVAIEDLEPSSGSAP